MNRKEDKNGKANRYWPPSPWELYQAHLLTADFRTGICSLTDEQWAGLFGCSVKSIRRAKHPLLEKGYLIRLYPNRQDVFIPKYERYIKEIDTWVRIAGPKVLKSHHVETADQTEMTTQVDRYDHPGGQIRPLRWTDTTSQVDTGDHTESDKSLEGTESQLSNNLRRNKGINNKVSSSSSSKPQKQKGRKRPSVVEALERKYPELRNNRSKDK
jgi:hypothetical protein